MPLLVSVSWQELAELGIFCDLLVAGALVTGLLDVGGSKGNVGDVTLNKKMLLSPGLPANGAKLLLLTFNLSILAHDLWIQTAQSSHAMAL